MTTKYFILLLTAYLFSCNGQTIQLRKEFEGNEMPDFKLLLTDSVTQFNTSTIPLGKPTVFVFFTPNCPYCRAFTQSVISDVKLKETKFYLLSPFPLSQLKAYYEEYKLKYHPNLIVGKDINFLFQDYFKPNGVPYIAVYGKDKRLLGVYEGKVSLKIIKDLILS